MKRSIALRLVAMFALATLVTFSLIGMALYEVLHNQLARHQQDELTTNLQDMQYGIQHMGSAERWPRVQAKMNTLTADDGSIRFWVLSDDPRFRYGNNPSELALMHDHPDGISLLTLPGRHYPMQIIIKSIPAFEERPPVRLVVGIDAASYFNTLHAFVVALVALSASAIVLVVVLGYWIAQVGLRPLQQLSREAQALNPRTPSQRLRGSPLPAELSDLANAFNGALARLEGTHAQLEAYNADVAHELRTPLANLIGQTQVALSRQRTAPEFQEVLQSNLEELERLRSIINDMLFLARADQGEAAMGLIKAPVDKEIGKTVDFFEVILDDLHMTVAVEGAVAAHALIETALFRRALSNLLQNAIQHSQPGARILITVTEQDDSISITVSNPGEPIAPAHLPRLFDRFYRVDAARHDEGVTHGHGLGLAIVKAVATMHGGGVFAFCGGGLTSIGFSVRGTRHGTST